MRNVFTICPVSNACVSSLNSRPYDFPGRRKNSEDWLMESTRRRQAMARSDEFVASWSSLIGAKSAKTLLSIRNAIGTGLVLIVLSGIVFLGFILFSSSKLITNSVPGFLALELVGLVLLAEGVARRLTLVGRIRREVRSTGRPARSNPDLRSPARFREWLERESVSAEDVGGIRTERP